MIGIEARGIRISVQHFPDRKRPSLCVEYFSKPAEIYVVGSFNSEEGAARFGAAIEDMFGKKKED